MMTGINNLKNTKMNKITNLLLAAFLFLNINLFYAQNETDESSYRYSINLTEIKNHKLPVTLHTPKIESDEVIFRIPKMVPGTYHVYNLGRFIYDFTAYDNGGNRLAAERVDSSSWKISGARSLANITYKARETWEPEHRNNFVFEPAGTDFDEDEIYILNNHTLFGYFEGMKWLNYEVDITKPVNFYGSTAMVPVFSDDNRDKFVYPDYHMLVHMPIMYTIPDTAMLKIGETDVLVSVYSEGAEISAKMLADRLKDLLEAQKNYLGGILPAKRYAYLVYFANESRSGAAGALEHPSSSLYFVVGNDTHQVKQTFFIFAAHEFLHILTPLTIQSDEIYDFDYANPKMSKHLWLYEGVTEYSAASAFVKGGLISEQEFLQFIKYKIMMAGNFNDTLPFTEMSKNVLDKYQNQYGNVYLKGALIAMCLDLKLRSLFGGKYGLKDLMAGLSKRYGIGKPFKDDELFDVITQMTYPEVRDFFRKYVEGPNPLPLKEMLELAGVTYAKSEKRKVFTLGNISLEMNAGEKGIIIIDTGNMNSFGKKMGYKKGDKIVSINGREVSVSQYREIIDELFASSKEGDELVVDVLRTDKNGASKILTLKAPMMKVERNVENDLKLDPDASEKQLKIREGWLGKN